MSTTLVVEPVWAASGADERQRLGGGLTTRARLGRACWIGITNLLLSTLTLWMYSSWGRARVRRYLWATTSFRGDRFEYTGTGEELFRGALAISGIVLLPLVVAQAALIFSLPAAAEGLDVLAIAPLTLFLSGVGRYRAISYRLSRTRWRGIGGTLTERGWAYGSLHACQFLLLGVTLGLAKPYGDVVLARRRLQTMLLGDRPVEFSGRTRAIVGRWLLCWVLFVPTLGASYAWYVAARERHFAASTRWEGLSCRFTAGGRHVFGLMATNIFLVIATVGAAAAVVLGYDAMLYPQVPIAVLDLQPEAILAWLAENSLPLVILSSAGLLALGPVFATRWLRFLCAHLEIEGEVDWAGVRQAQMDRARAAEGLATAFDSGAL